MMVLCIDTYLLRDRYVILPDTVILTTEVLFWYGGIVQFLMTVMIFGDVMMPVFILISIILILLLPYYYSAGRVIYNVTIIPFVVLKVHTAAGLRHNHGAYRAARRARLSSRSRLACATSRIEHIMARTASIARHLS